MKPQATILEHCPLCGQAAGDVLVARPEFTWVRCRCGLIYKRSEAAAETPAAVYDEHYFVTSDRAPYSSRAGHRMQKARRQILDLLNHVEPGPLLDVGCSLGYTLRAARDLGMPAVGVDVSGYAVEECRKQGFAAEVGGMERLPFEDGKFQMVVMKHVLEHTPAPRRALSEVRRVLRPGGGLFLAVPHGGYFRAVRRPSTARFFMPGRAGRQHFVYYTPETLSRLLFEEGFTVARAHPHLFHRRAGSFERLGELLSVPALALAGLAASALALRKEFWLTAVKTARDCSPRMTRTFAEIRAIRGQTPEVQGSVP